MKITFQDNSTGAPVGITCDNLFNYAFAMGSISGFYKKWQCLHLSQNGQAI